MDSAWTRNERASELPTRAGEEPHISLYPLLPSPTGARGWALGARLQLRFIDRFSPVRREGAARSAYWARESRQQATGNTDQKGIPFFLSDSDPVNLRTCDPANMRPFDPCFRPHLPHLSTLLTHLAPAPFNIQSAPRGRCYRSS